MDGTNEVVTTEGHVCALTLATALITCKKVWECTEMYADAKNLASVVNLSNKSTSTMTFLDYKIDESLLYISLSHFLSWLNQQERKDRMQINVRQRCADAPPSYNCLLNAGYAVSLKVYVDYHALVDGLSITDKIHNLKEVILQSKKHIIAGLSRPTLAELMKELPLESSEVNNGAPRKPLEDLRGWYQKNCVKGWMAHAFSYVGINFKSDVTKKTALSIALEILESADSGSVESVNNKRKRASCDDDDDDDDEGVQLVMRDIQLPKVTSEEKSSALRLYDAHILSGKSESKARERSNTFLQHKLFWRLLIVDHFWRVAPCHRT